MAKKQAERRPPGRIKSSIVARLNTRLFFRLLGIYFTMDLLLTLLFCGGLFVWAEGQAAQISALVEERGRAHGGGHRVDGRGQLHRGGRRAGGAGGPAGWSPTSPPWSRTCRQDTSAPAESTASTVVITGGTAGQAAEAGSALAPLGFRLPGWLPSPAETEGGVRWFNPGTVDLLFLVTFSTGDTTSYTLYLPHDGDPYTIQIDLSSPAAIFVFAARVLLICQLVSLITNLFKNAGSIKKVLRPIQELAATAAKLNQASACRRRSCGPWRASWMRSTPPIWISGCRSPAPSGSCRPWPRPSTPCWTASMRPTAPRCASSPTPAMSCAPPSR